ncbi:helix-turn-helix domain-containing protein [Cellulophaga sp. BC115SP]|jgi:transcriptional regulator with XRE-family HTH domain|uniref:helix-turn-helix domain-containing protein n=1 Tax=Cellulophaga sp. BC115SP TaxID=2683263 RepID=UPI00141290C0|nr:helix-turn-helix transcriptional regulator [Cellulophaga sp. BC115SP]NBB26731.1 helix-turn-helix domain-containing protein [Cellulophaga sp. BC115SP]
MNENFASRIKKRRVDLGLTQDELAQKIHNTSKQTISNWEKGVSKPKYDELVSLATALHTTVGYLVDGVQPVAQNEPPTGFLLVEKDELIKMQKRMIELQEQVIEKQAKQNHSVSTPSESSISK